MLWLGPPTILIVGVPCISKAFRAGVTTGLCGSSTRIGIGVGTDTTPQAANARTVCIRLPLSKPEKKVCTLSVTSTRMNAVGARPAGGTVPVGTPVTLAGKVTLTRLPGDVLLLEYPFLAAYWHGAAVEPTVQLRAVPFTKP